MSKSKDALVSPFQNPHGHTVGPDADRGDIHDHNPEPCFSKPHDRGPDTIPVVFFEGVNGKQYLGPAEKLAEGAAVSSTMGGKK